VLEAQVVELGLAARTDDVWKVVEAVLPSAEGYRIVWVWNSLMALEDDYREPLVLQVLMGYTTDEIAAHLGIKSGAVLTRLYRARQKLRDTLIAQEITR